MKSDVNVKRKNILPRATHIAMGMFTTLIKKGIPNARAFAGPCCDHYCGYTEYGISADQMKGCTTSDSLSGKPRIGSLKETIMMT
jgi:hypothetical protein